MWDVAVLGRIERIIDLPAADAVYHQIFRTGKQLPLKYQPNKRQELSAKSPGRPIDKEISNNKLIPIRTQLPPAPENIYWKLSDVIVDRILTKKDVRVENMS